MPFGFPSHQGLVSPLWRQWPERFHILGLCVGAFVPDIVDGTIGAARGYLGQSYGHSLIGLFALCLPVGLVITEAMVWGLRRLAQSHANQGGEAPWWKRLSAALMRSDNVPAGRGRLGRWAFVAFSVWVGALSHLIFDFIAHDSFMWFYPWYTPAHFFPDWWYARWFDIPVPGYRTPFAAGPPMVVWASLSVGGAVMFIRAVWPKGNSR